MGAHSTLNISRKAAVKTIQEQLNRASNEDLGNVLFDLLGDIRLYNYRVLDVENVSDSDIDLADDLLESWIEPNFEEGL